ncbi:MAG: hypothetical protein ACJ8F7_08960 [Gemmataceae bacterium]
MRLPLALCAALLCAPLLAAEPPAVTAFQTQARADGQYFRIEFTGPALSTSARLVPQDDSARAVVPVSALTFAGKWRPGVEAASFRLLYTTQEPGRRPETAEIPVTLKRTDARPTDADLATAWAKAQLAEFAALGKQAPEFTFYSFAQLLLARKYGLALPAGLTAGLPTREAAHRQLFETHTGGAAVAESLQLHRLMNRDAAADEARTTSVSDVRGIDVPSHPWRKMMGDQRPAAEPLAEWVPHDNYYVHFRDLASLLEFGELLDLWGTNLIHAFEFQDRDAFVRDRYERQLCLPSRRLAKVIPPDWVRGIAVTGSDPYLADGSDVTVILHLTRPTSFLREQDAFIHESRLQFGDEWETRELVHRSVAVEGFVGPWREVSLYRAAVGDFVVCSNSLVGLQRVLDAHAKALPPLSEALDFQYMRTVFRAEDSTEDGFAFLPDAFIRRLMGPAGKMKQRRRAEALGRLSLVQSAALFAAWDTGTIPADLPALYAATGLTTADRNVAEGAPIAWDSARLARSAAYNTLRFATPLIELSIDKITPTERRDYEAYRGDYLRLWNQFFDPVGIRFRRNAKQVQVEAYILPLIQSDRYRLLRQVTGGKPYPFTAAMTPPGTLMQFQLKLGQDEPTSTWLALRLDDDPAFTKRMELLLRSPRDPITAAELERAFWNLPLTLGIGTKGAENEVEQLRSILRNWLGNDKPAVRTYKDVGLLRYDLDAAHVRDMLNQLRQALSFVGASEGSTLAQLFSFLPEKEMPKSIYAAQTGEAYYLSLREDCLKRIIDHELETKRAVAAGKTFPEMPAHTSLFIAPSARERAEGIRQYLEAQTRRRAWAGNAVWLPLHRAGVIGRDGNEADERAAALRWYGFEPISPDGAGFRYDRRLGEVVNVSHGSERQPTPHATLAVDAPVRRLMEQYRTLRTDLRFREDGIHTTVTFERARE